MRYPLTSGRRRGSSIIFTAAVPLPPSPPLRGRGAGGEGEWVALCLQVLHTPPLTPGPSPRSTEARGGEWAAAPSSSLRRSVDDDVRQFVCLARLGGEFLQLGRGRRLREA